ncbi:MAG: class I SAM-dependent methyltransferase [Deltaproteobacteria bacterium]|nr:class I SAM-dependent methyltransferase [Deltaproteobacteria bacterium]
MAFNLEDCLQCPDCAGRLKIGAFQVVCQGCGRTFAIEDGIYILLPRQQPPMPKFYDDPDYRLYLEKLETLHQVHYRTGSLTGRIEEDVKQRLAELILIRRPPLVDLGCGTGYGFPYLGSEEDIIGVDNNLSLLKECRQRFPKATLLCCDLRNSPFRPGSFKTLFSVGTLEHVFYLESFVEAAENCLEPTGRFYVEVPTEGGMLWGLCRALWTAPRNSRLLGVNYNRAIGKDHCNTVYTVHNVLEKFFEIEAMKQYPFGFGGFNVNLAMMYRLKKRP